MKTVDCCYTSVIRGYVMRRQPFEANSGAKVNNLASFPFKKMPSYGIMNKISHKKYLIREH